MNVVQQKLYDAAASALHSKLPFIWSKTFSHKSKTGLPKIHKTIPIFQDFFSNMIDDLTNKLEW